MQVQQKMQQVQQLGPQQQQGPQPSEIPLPPQSGQDFTLSSVLHFLQTEWRRYERDRNEWEIERAEMRARIALLEGERRSFDNVKLDLMRRIKMLEYALRVERTKQLNQPSTQSVPPTKLAAIQSQMGGSSQKDEGSSGSSPRSEDSPLPPEGPGAAINGPTRKTQTWSTGTGWHQTNGPSAGGPLGTLGKPPPGRDPKSRARSRDYLKQCLQEVSYLTSPQAMNPLPNRPLLNNSSLAVSLPNVPSFEPVYNGRPRKVLPEVGKDFLVNGMTLLPPAPPPPPGSGANQSNPIDRTGILGSLVPQQQQQQQQTSTGPPVQVQLQPATEQQQGTQMQDDKELPQGPDQDDVPTAIFRPDSAGEWREKLRQSHDAELARAQQAGGSTLSGALSWERRSRYEDEDLKTEEEPDVEDEESTEIEDGEGNKVWKNKRTLKNHLDAVRAAAFHPNELCLATGGDDNTVKIWRVDVAGLASSAARPTTEVEPQLTLRGHSAPITRLVHAPSKNLLYSASMDSSIRVWALPPSSHTTYAPYDATRARGELIGHTDAVWDLTLVRDENTLISCGAEGSVKVWDVSGPSGGGSLRLSWSYDGLDNTADGELSADNGDVPGASAVEAIKMDLKKVAVAYQNAVIKIFDIETGKEVIKLNPDPTQDGLPAGQVNSIVSHPTMPILVTGHEDKYIRMFDIITGQCTHSILAHLDAVTSVSLDVAGFALVSGSHDCSVRFWDVLGSKACVQEITNHREKAREGVLAVEFHPSLPFMASAGADGAVKLYASS
ncbi:WD40-repeat-containing domain protein [Irpex rosettiformis]|uniref:WD40-repeat-containing domain protein n=1 Tax=Irpex rosettiformis TaxID=378272 RepID=A0ACB8TUC2_9APHY|nr:WD40-repeat-containing domain protein [Irpex rosettiformis]